MGHNLEPKPLTTDTKKSGFCRCPALKGVLPVIVAGGFLHLQVQIVAGIWMGAGQFFVQLEPKARGFGGDDEAVLDL